MLTRGEHGEGAGVAARVQQAADNLGVERGAARRDPGDRVGELGDVGDPVLEQVADPPERAFSRSAAYRVSTY
jgi:hypothetical protein